MLIDKETLLQYESRYRALMLNSLAGVKQAFLIGTQSKEGHNNLAIFNSLIHIGANPPLWGFINRPDTVQRDTLTNILNTKQYTINYISAGDFEKAHQTSAKYETGTSEFEACGFTPQFDDDFKAPFVAEAPIKIAMAYEQRIDIALNNTILIIGRIEKIKLDEQFIAPDGFINLEQANTLGCAGLDAYYESKLIGRLHYAKTDRWPSKM
jgi:flavin reductase (DIM6/NTAB) family NADH-FMN oxidoreductase RutF